VTIISTGEKVLLTLKGAPMLMVLTIISLANLGLITYVVSTLSTIRSAERAELIGALRTCIERKVN
jgi:hypothetical protein